MDFGDIGHSQLLTLGDGILVDFFLPEDFKEEFSVAVGIEDKLLGGPCAALL